MKIGDVARDALIAGASDEDALAAVMKEFPEAKTKIASVKWYRSQLRREVKEGKREAGKEGPSRRRTTNLTRGQGMTPELAAKLRENATKRRDEKHAKQLKEQREREKARGPMPDRARLILSTARSFKKQHGFWPAPSDIGF
jgi:hypothetical protein